MTRRSTLSVAVALVCVAACSSTDDGAVDLAPAIAAETTVAIESDQAVDPTALTLGAPTAVPLEVDGFRPVQVSDDGRSWAQLVGEALCISVAGAATDCIEVGALDLQSISWSPDGSFLLASGDLLGRFDDPDVIRVDAVTGSVDVVTDDGVRSPRDPEALIDVQPFVGPDGSVYVFRSPPREGAEPFVLHRLGVDGATEPLAGVTLDAGLVPLHPARPVGSGRAAVAVLDLADGATQVLLMDLGAETFEALDVGGARLPQVVDTVEGLVLVEDRQSFRLLDDRSPMWLIDLEADTTSRVEVPPEEGRTMLAAGLGPEGAFVAGVVVGGYELPATLLGYPLSDDGLGEPVVIADGEDFLGFDDGGDRVTPVGVGLGVELLWTDDSSLVLGTGDGRLLTFEGG